MKHFLKNIWAFRKQLWSFRWWDYSFTLEMMEKCLDIMSTRFEKDGIEVDSSRLKKVAKMRRAMQLIQNIRSVSHIEQAEAELGELHITPIEFKDSESHPDSYELIDNNTSEEKEHNRKVFARANEIEKQEWNELWDIFKGQDIKKYKPKKQDWDDWYDGSGMNSWWD
jgi:hypothetical protein